MTAEPVGRPPNPAIVIALCSGYGIYCLLTLPPGPITAPDSHPYLIFAPTRSLGYPIFLRLLGASGVMVVQPVLFAVALASLGVQTLRLTSSVLLSSAVVVAVMVTFELRTYHYSVLTESPFASLMLACFACVLSFVRAPSRGARVSAGGRDHDSDQPAADVDPLGVVRRRLVPAVVILGGERVAARPTPQPSADPQRAPFDEELDVYFAPMRQILRTTRAGRHAKGDEPAARRRRPGANGAHRAGTCR